MEKSCQTNENAPVYFLDLIVENVRCFRKRQMLDLSDGHGRPARWTVLLGDNGTGKTTLLKCLAALEPVEDTIDRPDKEDVIISKGFVSDYKFKRYGHNDFQIKNSRFYLGLIDSDKPKYSLSFRLSDKLSSIHIESGKLGIYAYGASRRMGTGSLSETQSPDNSASLFYDDVSLINAEEWLLQADFAVKSADDESKSYFENRFARIKELLITLLPDVENIRIRPITKEQKKPGIGLRTPYGWVGLKKSESGVSGFDRLDDGPGKPPVRTLFRE